MTTLRRVTALGAALVLAASVSACGKDSSSDSSSSSSSSQSQQAASSNGGATPQEAVQNVFSGLSAGDAEKACRQMAYEKGGQKGVVADDPAQMAGCKTNVQMAVSGMKPEQKAALGMVQVTKAEEKGDTATVSGKDMTAAGQPMETMVTKPITLSKINGRWFVDVSSMWALAGGMAAGSTPTA